MATYANGNVTTFSPSLSSTVMDHSLRQQQEHIYNNDENISNNDQKMAQHLTSNNSQIHSEDVDHNPSITNEVNSPFSQAAILQAAPSLMSIRSCFVSSASQPNHPSSQPSMKRQSHQHHKKNLAHQHKATSKTSNNQNSNQFRAQNPNENFEEHPSKNFDEQHTQSQPQLSSSGCYSSQPFLASATNGSTHPYKKQSSAMPSQTVLQYKNGVLQLTSISGGQYGPRGMSSSADKLTLSASHHNSNTSLPFHEQVKNLSKLVKTNQTSHKRGGNQGLMSNGSSNYKLDSSGSNSVSSSLQSEIDVESLGMHPSARMIQVGNLFANAGNKVRVDFFVVLFVYYKIHMFSIKPIIISLIGNLI